MTRNKTKFLCFWAYNVVEEARNEQITTEYEVSRWYMPWRKLKQKKVIESNYRAIMIRMVKEDVLEGWYLNRDLNETKGPAMTITERTFWADRIIVLRLWMLYTLISFIIRLKNNEIISCGWKRIRKKFQGHLECSLTLHHQTDHSWHSEYQRWKEGGNWASTLDFITPVLKADYTKDYGCFLYSPISKWKTWVSIIIFPHQEVAAGWLRHVKSLSDVGVPEKHDTRCWPLLKRSQQKRCMSRRTRAYGKRECH